MITVIGLGAGDLNQLPLGIYRLLTESDHVFLRTKEHPVIDSLVREGLTYTSFDHIYEKHDSFEEVYEEIAQVLIEEGKKADIIYGVPGHPLVAERTVQLLIEKKAEMEIKGGQSFLDDMFTSLCIDPIEGFQFVDATSFQPQELQLRHHLIFCQVYDAYIASEVKLSLSEILPYDYEVYIVTAAGSADERMTKVPLFELDRATTLNNLTSVYIPPAGEELLRQDFASLRQTIATLRGPDGCPWDKEQTNESLKKYLIEEAYELLDAIDEEDDEHIVEELGDVLLQVMLHAQIGEDEGWFSIDEVIGVLNEKMIRRHPHVFADASVENSTEVLKNWDEIKKTEKQYESILANIPNSLPGLMRAYQLQKKAAKVGFDWNEPEPMLAKVYEELDEWQEELKQGSGEAAITKEFGDILFSLVNLARYYKIEPELAIQDTNKKFQRRFSYIEEQVKNQEKQLTEMSLAELDALWNEAKENE